jgi:hypothetical protein
MGGFIAPKQPKPVKPVPAADPQVAINEAEAERRRKLLAGSVTKRTGLSDSGPGIGKQLLGQ